MKAYKVTIDIIGSDGSTLHAENLVPEVVKDYIFKDILDWEYSNSTTYQEVRRFNEECEKLKDV